MPVAKQGFRDRVWGAICETPNLEEPRQGAETTPVMWRRRAKVAVQRDGSGNRRGVEAEGGDDTGDVKTEGGGGNAGPMDPTAGGPRDRRSGVEAEGGDGTDDVEATTRRDGGGGGNALAEMAPPRGMEGRAAQ
uniref:Uncharacterized protein n=1 Tax=Oryza barthii TaxID=65489 RepID=A0A0D3FUX7_9ORYZ